MSSFNYLDYICQKNEDPYWKEILNTSYDMLPHKLEILNSEIMKNKFEIKKIVVENLDDYLLSKDISMKMANEIEKNKMLVKSSLEITNDTKNQKIKCDLKEYNEISQFINNFSILLEMDKLIKILSRKENEKHMEKLIEFIKATLHIYSTKSKNKLTEYLEKLLIKIKEIVFEKFISIKFDPQNSHETSLMNPHLICAISNISIKDLINELFIKDVKHKICTKVEKYHLVKGNFDYLEKLFCVYTRSIEKSFQKILKLYDSFLIEEQISLKKLQNFQKIFLFFEKNFKLLLKNYNEEETFLELISEFPVKDFPNNLLLILMQNILEDHLQKLFMKFEIKLEILIRYGYINNLFLIMLKKADNSSFDDLISILNDEHFEKSEKFQKFLNFVRKNEIFSLLYNNLISIYSFCSMYLKEKIRSSKILGLINDSFKRFLESLRKFLDLKINLTEEEKSRIGSKIEKFVEIMFILIDKCFILKKEI